MTPLPPDVTRTIRSSCKPLLERQEQFHGEFHASLVDLMPEVPLMREPAGAQVSRWLVECVLWAVNADDPVPMIGATLQGVGLDAHRLGFPRSGYQAVGHALLRTVRGAYQAEWSGTLSSSWIGYHSWLCEYWISGADIGQYEDQARPLEPVPYQQPQYQQAQYQQAQYPPAEYESAEYQQAQYQQAQYEQAQYEQAQYEQTQYQQAPYQQAGIDPPPTAPSGVQMPVEPEPEPAEEEPSYGRRMMSMTRGLSRTSRKR